MAPTAEDFRASIVVKNHTAMTTVKPPRKQKGRMDVERDNSF
jgi:hypothetical protein